MVKAVIPKPKNKIANKYIFYGTFWYSNHNSHYENLNKPSKTANIEILVASKYWHAAVHFPSNPASPPFSLFDYVSTHEN